ncbi:MAG: hypothetical protein M3P85_01665 [Actinomycetota bacterium]|nr:hypothetical protein [Actinomycetota bacterium]
MVLVVRLTPRTPKDADSHPGDDFQRGVARKLWLREDIDGTEASDDAARATSHDELGREPRCGRVSSEAVETLDQADEVAVGVRYRDVEVTRPVSHAVDRPCRAADDDEVHAALHERGRKKEETTIRDRAVPSGNGRRRSFDQLIFVGMPPEAQNAWGCRTEVSAVMETAVRGRSEIASVFWRRPTLALRSPDIQATVTAKVPSDR